MKKFSLMVISLAILSCLSFNAYAITPQRVDVAKAAINLSFSLSASRGKLIRNPNGTNTYTLELSGIKPYITYYTNRPARVSGLAALTDFTKAWEVGGARSFTNDNPNGILYAALINGAPNRANKFYVLQFAKPQYDQSRSIVRFEVAPIGSQKIILSENNMQYINVVIN